MEDFFDLTLALALDLAFVGEILGFLVFFLTFGLAS